MMAGAFPFQAYRFASVNFQNLRLALFGIFFSLFFFARAQ